MSETVLSIKATDISEYIRYQSCDRRFKLKLNDFILAKQLPFAQLIFDISLDPVLEGAGRIREDEGETSLQKLRLFDIAHYCQKTNNQSNVLEHVRF